MTADPATAYLRSKVMSASPAELRLMLIEGAIRFARQGREGLASKNYEQSFHGLSQAKSIILELINSLRPEVDPELCAKLSALYTFMYRRLLDANMEKSPAICDEVISLLEFERETWVLLMERLAQEQRGDAAVPPGADGREGVGAGAARAPLSVEG